MLGKKCFFTGLVFLSNLTGVNLLRCIWMNNQECKVKIANVNGDDLCFFLLVLKQVNAVVRAAI